MKKNQIPVHIRKLIEHRNQIRKQDRQDPQIVALNNYSNI